MSWTGRQLDSVTKDGVTTTYDYDSSGMRTSKTVGSTTYAYLYYGGQLVRYTVANEGYLYFHYDDNGTPLGFTYDGVNGTADFYYVLNLQGDIVQVRDSSRSVYANYSYDAWGKLLSITDAQGNEITDEEHVAVLNPLRYRGYVYDSETGFYYLNSRYYDPEVKRFISADTTDILTASPTALTDKNLYAYCDNNPVMRADNGGEFWNVIASAVIGGAISAVSQIVTNVTTGKKWSDGVGMATVSGALSGGLAATGFGKTGQMIGNAIISGASEVYNQYQNYKNNPNNFDIGAATGSVLSSTGFGVLSGAIGGKGARAKGSCYRYALNKRQVVNNKIASGVYKNSKMATKMLRKAKTLVRSTGNIVTKETSVRFFAGTNISQYGMRAVNELLY